MEITEKIILFAYEDETSSKCRRASKNFFDVCVQPVFLIKRLKIVGVKRAPIPVKIVQRDF